MPWLLPRGLLEAFPGAQGFFWTIVFAAASPCKRRIQESSWKMEITENLAAESCAVAPSPVAHGSASFRRNLVCVNFTVFLHTQKSLCVFHEHLEIPSNL